MDRGRVSRSFFFDRRFLFRFPRNRLFVDPTGSSVVFGASFRGLFSSENRLRALAGFLPAWYDERGRTGAVRIEADLEKK